MASSREMDSNVTFDVSVTATLTVPAPTVSADSAADAACSSAHVRTADAKAFAASTGRLVTPCRLMVTVAVTATEFGE